MGDFFFTSDKLGNMTLTDAYSFAFPSAPVRPSDAVFVGHAIGDVADRLPFDQDFMSSLLNWAAGPVEIIPLTAHYFLLIRGGMWYHCSFLPVDAERCGLSISDIARLYQLQPVHFAFDGVRISKLHLDSPGVIGSSQALFEANKYIVEPLCCAAARITSLK